MSPPLVTYRLDVGPLMATLEGIRDRMTNLRPVWEGVVDPALREMWREGFASEGRSLLGQRWAPLRPLTLLLKARAGRGRMGILRFSDDLYKSLVVRGDAKGIRIIEAHRAVFGTSVPHARPHQEGIPPEKQLVFGRKPTTPRGMPARPLVPTDQLPKATAAAIQAGTARYLKDGVA